MKRDKELLRTLLQDFEKSDTGLLLFVKTMSSPPKDIKDLYHVELLCDNGLVTHVGKGSYRLTATGHDAAEALENSETWALLKSKGPQEAYGIIKGVTSSFAVTALSKLMGWG